MATPSNAWSSLLLPAANITPLQTPFQIQAGANSLALQQGQIAGQNIQNQGAQIALDKAKLNWAADQRLMAGTQAGGQPQQQPQGAAPVMGTDALTGQQYPIPAGANPGTVAVAMSKNGVVVAPHAQADNLTDPNFWMSKGYLPDAAAEKAQLFAGLHKTNADAAKADMDTVEGQAKVSQIANKQAAQAAASILQSTDSNGNIDLRQAQAILGGMVGSGGLLANTSQAIQQQLAPIAQAAAIAQQKGDQAGYQAAEAAGKNLLTHYLNSDPETVKTIQEAQSKKIEAAAKAQEMGNVEFKTQVGVLAAAAAAGPATYADAYKNVIASGKLSQDQINRLPPPNAYTNPNQQGQIRGFLLNTSMAGPEQATFALDTQKAAETARHNVADESIQRYKAQAEMANAIATRTIALTGLADHETTQYGGEFATDVKAGQEQLHSFNQALTELGAKNPDGSVNVVAQTSALPKLFSSLSGGEGTGVRFTTTELNLLLHSRGYVGDAQAILQKLGSGAPLTPAQVAQAQGVVMDAQALAAQKLRIESEGYNKIAQTDNRAQKIQVQQQTNQLLNAMGSGNQVATHPDGTRYIYSGNGPKNDPASWLRLP